MGGLSGWSSDHGSLSVIMKRSALLGHHAKAVEMSLFGGGE